MAHVGYIESNGVGGTVTRHVGGPVRLVHFTPETRSCWCWYLMAPEISLAGPQRTIDGKVVDIGASGSSLWSVLPGTDRFATREEALRWCELVPGVFLDRVDID